MAVELVAVGSYANPSTGSTSATFSLPTGIVAGDFIALMDAMGSSSITYTAAPSGFTQLDRENATGTIGNTFFYKIADGSDSGRSITVTTSAGVKHAVIMLVYRGVDNASPIAGYAKTSAASTTTIGTPTLTAPVPSVELSFVTVTKTSGLTQVTNYTVPAPLTERREAFTVTTTGGASPSAVGADNLTLATSMGGRAVTQDQAAAAWSGWTIALRPGAVAAPDATLDHWWTGAQTSSGAQVKVHTPNATSVRLQVADNSGMTTNVRYTSPVTPDADAWSAHTISDMSANSTAYYRVETTDGDSDVVVQSQVNRVRSLPTPGAPASFAFTASSCFGHTSPNRTGIAIDGMRTQDSPLFSVIMGDYGYYDVATDVLADHLAPYLDILTASRFPAFKTLLQEVPTYYIKSDHDSGPPDNNPGIYTAPNRTAYKKVVPHPALNDPDGIYFSFLVGRVRFIFTDARYLRSIRSATDDASKSMLGATQKQWLKDRLLDTGELKVWVHESEWLGTGWSSTGDEPNYLGTDSWMRYLTERTEIGNFIVANGLSDKIFYLSGNGHHLSVDNGSNNPAGGFASACAAPGHRDTTYTGGPWSEGSYIRTGVEGTISQQFCSVQITDDGSSINLLWKGYDAEDLVTPKLTYTMTVAEPTAQEAAGSAAATSAVSGSATVRAAAAGSVAATTALAGAAAARMGVAGTVAAVTATSGSASVVGGPVVHPAAGVVTVVSATTGTVTMRVVASGAVTAATSTAGAATALYRTTGEVAATTATAGSATVKPGGPPTDFAGRIIDARLSIAKATGRVSILQAKGVIS